MIVKNVIKGHMAHDEIERLIIIKPDTDEIGIYAGTFRDVVLRKRESTGKVISELSYFELFDVVTDKLKEGGRNECIN